MVGIVLASVRCAGDPGGDAPPSPGTAPDMRPPPLVDYVDPFIGSGGVGFGVGSGFPGASAPFGLVKLGPSTSAAGGSATAP